MINKLADFFSLNGADYGCVSACVVGSYANNTNDILSDLDIVIIGENQNYFKQIKYLGLALKNFISNKIDIESIYYCEPSQEILCLLDASNVGKMRVHLIYHPLKRFEYYISNKDHVLLSWKNNYAHLFGNDFLKSALWSGENIDFEIIFTNTINLIVQNLHNSYLLTDISSNPTYYLKLYKFILKRLRELENTPQFSLALRSSPFSLVEEFCNFNSLLAFSKPDHLKEKFIAIEETLIKLQNYEIANRFAGLAETRR